MLRAGRRVFVHVFHSVFVEVYPTFAVHFTFHRLVGCRCFGRLLCAEQCASSKQQVRAIRFFMICSKNLLVIIVSFVDKNTANV